MYRSDGIALNMTNNSFHLALLRLRLPNLCKLRWSHQNANFCVCAHSSSVVLLLSFIDRVTDSHLKIHFAFWIFKFSPFVLIKRLQIYKRQMRQASICAKEAEKFSILLCTDACTEFSISSNSPTHDRESHSFSPSWETLLLSQWIIYSYEFLSAYISQQNRQCHLCRMTLSLCSHPKPTSQSVSQLPFLFRR